MPFNSQQGGAMSSASDSATSFLRSFGYTHPPVPVEEIAALCNIQLVRTAAEWSESGFLLRDAGRTIIGVNSRTSLRRQRFTIAHELGHWRLHEGKPLIVDQSVMMVNKRNDISSQATNSEEIEANQFAAELLMPQSMVASLLTKSFSSSLKSRDDLIATLAREFDVSNDAMSWRLINLGIVSN